VEAARRSKFRQEIAAFVIEDAALFTAAPAEPE